MDNIETKILTALQGRPGIFFAEDAAIEGVTMQAVRFSLASLAKQGHIVRLARGIYCHPLLEEHSNRRILPGAHEIAMAVAERGNFKIIPSGARAARNIGLTHDPVDVLVWLTTGGKRHIGIAGGRTLWFIPTGESRLFSFADERMRDVSLGLRHIGEAHVGDYEKDAVRLYIRDVPEETYREDFWKCPEWVREILVEARGKGEKSLKMAEDAANEN